MSEEVCPGLRKELERAGDAAKGAAAPGALVAVHFTCRKSSDGSEVDSTRGEFTSEVQGITVRKAKRPLEFTLPGEGEDGAEHIKGFTLAIKTMALGERATFYVAPELGYGEPGKGSAVGPGEALEFDMELVGVNKVYKLSR